MEEKEQTSVKEPEVVTKTEPQEKEKKSGGCMKGCLIVLGIFLLLFILLILGGYLGYRRVVKGMKQQDFGITYSEQDYLDLMDTLEIEAEPSKLCIDCPTPSFSEPKEISVTVNNKQASAAFEYINQYLSYASVSNSQIRINNGNAELTTNLTFQGKTFPIYMKGSISKATENSLSGDITELKAGSLPIPNSIKTLVKDTLLEIANDKISSAGDTVRIDSVELKEGGVDFKGLVPSKIY
jgi:hypothetical protein